MIKELDITVDKLLLDLEKKNQKINSKIMYDETGRPMIVRLYHDYTFDYDFDKITLFIGYLDNSTIRIYKPSLFSLNSKFQLITIYRMCKDSEYEEYTIDKYTLKLVRENMTD